MILSPRPLTIALHVLAAVSVAGALLAVAAGTALADNGPHVQGTGGGTGATAIATSDGCAGCHRAHTGQGSSLLVSGGDLELCLACHGSTVQGATTNVIDGILVDTNAHANSTNGLMGGGFTNTRMDTSWSATTPAPTRSATSAHINNGSYGTAWGSGAIGSGAGQTQFALSCVSCHNPHGNGQYRILRPIPMNAPATTEISITDPIAKVYTVSSAVNRYFGQISMNGVDADQVALSRWCAQCHTRYDAATPNSANTSSGDPIFNYRHGTRKVASNASSCDSCHPGGNGTPNNPLGIGSAIAHVPSCQNCHVAHGTSAIMGTQSGGVAFPNGTKAASDSARSSLLRLDNRGVCRACHGR